MRSLVLPFTWLRISHIIYFNVVQMFLQVTELLTQLWSDIYLDGWLLYKLSVSLGKGFDCKTKGGPCSFYVNIFGEVL